MFTLDIFNKHFQTPFQFHFTDKLQLSAVIKALEFQAINCNIITLKHGDNQILILLSDYAGYRVTDLTDATNFQLELGLLQQRLQQDFMSKPRLIPVKGH